MRGVVSNISGYPECATRQRIRLSVRSDTDTDLLAFISSSCEGYGGVVDKSVGEGWQRKPSSSTSYTDSSGGGGSCGLLALDDSRCGCWCCMRTLTIALLCSSTGDTI